MPIYEYTCLKCDSHFEVMQKMTDKPLARCSECGGKVEKQWSVSGVQFAGSGWYVTDYAGRQSSDSKSEDDKSEDSKSSGDKKGDEKSKDAATKETKGSGEKSESSGASGKSSGASEKSSSAKPAANAKS